MTALTICLVGNPNCGKTTVFNALTGGRQRVGNWPGVTVERRSGRYRRGAADVTVIDLPGVYSLGQASISSIDESIARDFILSGEADLVVNVVDASNIERNLYLTAQLVEMRVPTVIAFNMMDVARDRDIAIDVDAVADHLGCAIVPLVASRGDGIDHLRAVIEDAARHPKAPTVEFGYAAEIETAVAALIPSLEAIKADDRFRNARWLALKLLEDDAGVGARVPPEIHAQVAALQEEIVERADEDADILIADARYSFAHTLIQNAVTRTTLVSRTLSDRIDALVLNRILGIPIFLAVMYLMFLFTINLGSAFIDFFDILVGTVLVDGVGAAMAGIGLPDWLIALVAGGIGGGIQTVATFIPVIGCLYLFLSFLEDSGYMARAAFVMDRFMRAVGLPGKSFIPLIVGFGCNVPAIMATRTLEHRRERIMTIMMAPFMSCGARLPVYALFAAAFFPTGGQNVVFALYLIGIGFAVMTGLVLKTTVLKGESAPFVMELPPYHIPTAKGIALHTWERLKSFLFRAGRVIVAVVVILSFLNSWGTDGSFGNEDSEQSVLAVVGKSITPVFAPMGLNADNWPATVGIFTGVFAKEAVVGTLDALYSALATEPAATAEPEPPFDIWTGVKEAFATIPANLSALADAVTDPLGLGIARTENVESAAEVQAVNVGTFGAMAARFDGQIGAFAYLLAILLYMPCVAAVAAIYREVGASWTVFAAFWTSGLAYGAGVAVYQAGTFAAHPHASGLWIGGIVASFAAVCLVLRHLGARPETRAVTVAAE